jgi:hypothetical protein
VVGANFWQRVEDSVMSNDEKATEPTNANSVAPAPAASSTILEGARLVAYGRSDSRADLDRAAEIQRELDRLQGMLHSLSDQELSAFSTKSFPIGTFLHGRGHAFSVLTEEMLARQFDEELKRRQDERRQRRTNLIGWVTVAATLAGVGATFVIAHQTPQDRPVDVLLKEQPKEEGIAGAEGAPKVTLDPPAPDPAKASAPTGNAVSVTSQKMPDPTTPIGDEGGSSTQSEPRTAGANVLKDSDASSVSAQK